MQFIHVRVQAEGCFPEVVEEKVETQVHLDVDP